MVQIIVVMVVLGICWYFLSPYIGEPFKTILTILIVLLFCLWLLGLFGIGGVPHLALSLFGLGLL